MNKTSYTDLNLRCHTDTIYTRNSHKGKGIFSYGNSYITIPIREYSYSWRMEVYQPNQRRCIPFPNIFWDFFYQIDVTE